MGNVINYEWLSVLPEGFLVAGSAVLIAVAAFARSKRIQKIAAWSGVFLIAVALFIGVPLLAGSSLLPESAGSYFGGTLGDANGFSAFVFSCALLSAVMAAGYYGKDDGYAAEFVATLMICSAALSLFVRSNNLMLSFVSLEAATICLYAMVAWNKNRSDSLEAAVKYLVVGGASGAIFLLGVAFIYGAGLSSKANLLNMEFFAAGLKNWLFIAGLCLVSAGAFFKIAAFPFQFWAPDVYQGAPAPASAFLSVASKGAGIAFLMKLFTSLGLDYSSDYALSQTAVVAISAIAIGTILVGNLGGLTQVNVKRLIAFSGISNAGYMLILVAAAVKSSDLVQMAESSLYFYLAAYMFANYGLFFVINQFPGDADSLQTFSDYRGMLKGNKTLSSTAVVGLASLAGIPPTAGFLGKVLIFVAAVYAQLYWLVGLLIVGSTISIYYYFGWIRAICDDYNPNESCSARPAGRLAPLMFGLSVASVFFGAIFLCKVF